MGRFTSCGLSLFALAACAQTGVWQRLADYPLNAFEVSAAAFDGRVYAACGLTPAGATNRMFVYEPRINQWREAAAAPFPNGADHCNFAAANGKLYILGALVRAQGPAFADGATYEYDPSADKWTTVARMPTARAASGVAVIGTKIYVAGGISGNTNYAAMEVFDTVAREWTTLPPMGAARDHLTAQAISGRFYAIAGHPGRGQNTAAVEEFDPVPATWRTRAPIPIPGGGMASGVVHGRIVVAGGGAGFTSSVEYDPETDRWRELAPMASPRNGWYGSGAVIEDALFLPAGGPIPGTSYSTVFDVFLAPPLSAPRISAVRQAASFKEQLSPGAIVSIFGADLGGSALPLGVRVTVNGEDAQVLYAGRSQLNTVLPVSIATGPAQVQVWNSGVASAKVDIEIAEAAPAIFTLDGSGSGAGAIVIAGTRSMRPARRGELIELYGTGFPADAQPAFRIGGVHAPVRHFGDVPGVAGLQQIRLEIMADTPAGDAIVISGMSSGVATNPVTVAINASPGIE